MNANTTRPGLWAHDQIDRYFSGGRTSFVLYVSAWGTL